MHQPKLEAVPTWVRSLDNLTAVLIEVSGVNEMKAGVFPPSLQQLDISQQVGGLALYSHSLEGMSELRELDVGANFVTDEQLHAGMFDGTRLEELKAEQNRGITRFDATALFPGDSGGGLTRLELYECGLSVVEGGWFAGLQSLEVLDLHKNNMVQLSPDAFEGLGSLKELDLSENELTTLEAGVFSGGLEELQVLRLHENPFGALQRGLFAGLGGLVELTLGGEPGAYEDGAFEGLDCAVLVADDALQIMCAEQNGGEWTACEDTSWEELEADGSIFDCPTLASMSACSGAFANYGLSAELAQETCCESCAGV
jgi:hypothetical protein